MTTLHVFDFTNDGEWSDGLVQASDGNFYGTTEWGGANLTGTIFKVTPEGKFSIVYAFCSQANCADGGESYTPLIEATDGNLYGTTIAGGSNGDYGTIFQFSLQGKLTAVHSFDGTDGCDSYVPLLQATNGIFYSAETRGGLGCAPDPGSVYSLDMGLGPFVAFVRNSGRVGQTRGIFGQGFTGTTGVSFNSVAATYTVISDTYLSATVPASATTGFVTVVTPSGTLTSNVQFHVLP